MRKLLSVILLAALFISACSGGSGAKPEDVAKDSQSTAAQADGPGVTKTSIKVGAWLPLTGPIAVYGVTQRAGTESYLKMVNDKGGVNGRKIEWVVEDYAYDPQKAVVAARKLVERDEVFAIVNAHGTAQSAATFSYLLDEAKVPVLNIYGGAKDWWAPVKPNLFGVMVPYEDQANALGRWAAKEGAKNILVVHSDPAAFENVAKNVEPGVASANSGAKVTLMPVKYQTTDYVPIAIQVANAKPDAVVAILAINELVSFAKELERQNAKLPLYTYAPNVSLDAIELGGSALEGLRSVSWTVPPTANLPEVEEYRQALKKYAPDSKPDFQSLFTWAEAKILVEVLSRMNGPITRENFVKALESLSNFETGILPPVSFTADNHLGVKGLQPVQLEKGEWKLVGGFIDPSEPW